MVKGRSKRRWAPSRWVLGAAVLVASGQAQSPTKKPPKDADVFEMMRHAFETPIDYETGLTDWWLSGGTIPANQAMMLMPGIPERYGFFWHKSPLLTADFEVTFKVTAGSKTELGGAKKQSGFAFWYVNENINGTYPEAKVMAAKTWMEGLNAEGWDSGYGYKGKFDGLGVFFSNQNAASEPTENICAVIGDGNTAYKYGSNLPTTDATTTTPFRNKSKLQVRIRVRDEYVAGYIRDQNAKEWKRVFQIWQKDAPKKVGKGGWVGFTGFSGEKGSEKLDDCDEVHVHDFHIVNYDTTTTGEELADALPAGSEELLKDRFFKDQAAQTAALKNLSWTIADYLNTIKPREGAMITTLNSMQRRVGRIDESVRLFTKEVKFTFNKDGNVTHAQGLNSEIKGLRKIFTAEATAHRDALEALSKTFDGATAKLQDEGDSTYKVSVIQKQQGQLEDKVASIANNTSWMLGVVLLIAVGVGLGIFNRMRYYEKKHLL